MAATAGRTTTPGRAAAARARRASARVVVRSEGGQQRERERAAVFGCRHELIELETRFPGGSLHDVTAPVREAVRAAGMREGMITLASQHTTLAVTVNEYERRLVEYDVRHWLDNEVARPSAMYMHNDIEVRRLDEPEMPEDEPKNAHAHLQQMTIGNSESCGVRGGQLLLGTYQSLIAVVRTHTDANARPLVAAPRVPRAPRAPVSACAVHVRAPSVRARPRAAARPCGRAVSRLRLSDS